MRSWRCVWGRRVSAPVEVPEDIVERIRTLCLALPEVTVRVDYSRTRHPFCYELRRHDVVDVVLLPDGPVCTQPPADHACVTSTRSEAAAAARIGAALALRKRAELLGLLRPCFARTESWLQAGKYVSALAGELPRVNGWSIARHAGDRTPDKTQRC